jgi:hypothetical protein
VRALALAAALAASGCFAEIAGGYYRSSGSSDEPEMMIGLNAGVYLEYARTVRVSAGGDAQLPLGSGTVRQRGYGTTVKADLTLAGTPKHRLRASGALQFGEGGDTKVELAEGMATYGSVETDGWFLGLTYETTTGAARDRVTQSYTIGPHVLTSTSDILGERRLSGVQLRVNHTFWPTYRRVSPGVLGALANMLAHNTVAGEGEIGGGPEYQQTCVRNTECTFGLLSGMRCLDRQYCY